MDVLVVNAGSSSLKYQLLKVETNDVLAKGLCEKVGSPDSFLKYKFDEDADYTVVMKPMADHHDALQLAIETLLSDEESPISSLDDIAAAGHRIVSGGEYFSQSVFIDDDALEKIEICSELAPLHNPGALMGIRACMDIMPTIPQVAVFDTAFYQTIPPSAYMYPLPLEYYDKYKIRKYGAHGTSHRYISERAAAVMGYPLEDLKLITCHLGNGASITAIDHGSAVDTSMGFTPLDGLMMGTRCGSIDPAIVTYLMRKEGLSPLEMDDVMNRRSGLLGISGISNDLREVRDAATRGDERAILAYEMYAHSVRKYIGQYLVEMAGVDAIVLTAGVGENCERMRRQIFTGLEPIGIILDQQRNRLHGFERIISDDRSRVKVIVIPTNEEYMIARDVYELIEGKKLPSARYREEETYASEIDSEGPFVSER